MANYPVIPGTLTRTCFDSIQALNNAICNAAVVQVPDALNGAVKSETAPSAEDRDKAWIRTVSGKFDRVYVYDNGLWVSPHPVPYDSRERIIFVGQSADVTTHDGGTSGTVTPTAGPFWQIDVAFDGRMPLGAGELPTSGTVVAPETTGGADEVEMTIALMPEHKHLIPVESGSLGPNAADNLAGYLEVGGNDIFWNPTSTNTFTMGDTRKTGTPLDSNGKGPMLPTLNPYVAVYFLKRTIRQYYTAS